MINDILNAMVAPFTKQIGWQGFAYGVTGRIIVTYGRNFIEQYSDTAADASEETEDDLTNN